MSHLGLFILGPPKVQIDHQLINFPTRKTTALLTFLAVTGAPHPRDTLATLLWPDLNQTRARASLRNALWTLGRAGLADWLEIYPESVGLRSGYDLDVATFQHKLSRSLIHRHPADVGCPECITLLSEAVVLYRGDFLDGFSLHDSPNFDEWQLFQAESLSQDLAIVLEKLVHLHCAAEEWETAISHARHWLNLDNLHEPAHRFLMQLYTQTGKRGLALKQYETLRQTLHKELGIEPEAESKDLYRKILSGRFLTERGFTDHQPPPLHETRPRHNLPSALTPIIGRELELAQIRLALQAPSDVTPPIRLLTLCGPGGVGKTRLAQEIASSLLESYPGGVLFVELAGVSDPTLVVRAVATTLGLQEQPGQELSALLTASLRECKQVLLVMDNCEHVLAACAELCIALLKDCSELQILATSRQALGISGEVTFPVMGLSLPPDPGMKKPGPEFGEYISFSPTFLLEKSQAVQLFVERGKRVQPNFDLTVGNGAAVAHLCRQLDGLPLALELAASRLNVLSPEGITTRLSEGFQLLRSRSRDAPERHQSLQAAMDWSYSLLSLEERAFFNRLSVFRSGFTLEAAEAVGALEPRIALDRLASLVEMSMVVAKETDQGEVRYFVLETLRQYGQERLVESGEIEIIQQQHAAYYKDLAETTEPETRGQNQVFWFDRLETEHDNMRSALSWAFDCGAILGNRTAIEIGVRLVQGMWWFWYARAYWNEAFQWSSRCLSVPLEQLPPIIQIRAYAYASIFGFFPLKDYGLQYAEKALSLAKQFDDKEGLALSLWVKGMIGIHLGWKEHGLGKNLLEESLTIYRRLGDQFFIGWALFYLAYSVENSFSYLGSAQALYLECFEFAQKSGNKLLAAEALDALGEISIYLGNYSEARAYQERSITLFHQAESTIGDYNFYQNMGYIDLSLGNFAQAEEWFQKSLMLDKEIGLSSRISRVKNIMGEIYRLKGNLDLASEYYRSGLLLSREENHDASAAQSLYGLGYIALARNDLAGAFSLHKESLNLRQKMGNSLSIIDSIDALAECSAACQQHERAARLFGASDVLHKFTGYRIPPVKQAEHNRWLAYARESINKNLFEEAWRLGEKLVSNGLEGVVAYALEEADFSTSTTM